MYEVFADLHIHIGRAENGKPIKITAARSLNFANIAKECAEKKGINMVGIIDCGSPYVIQDIERFLQTGEAFEIPDGGIIYKNKVCIILGSEIETSEKNDEGKTGSAHNLCYFPTLKDIKDFSNEMSNHIKNITLSSQRASISAYELIDIVEKYHGILIPAHCFTPHKSFYGNCTSSLRRIFKEKYDKIPAIELGLSSDTFLADQITELETKTFLTNSDAHSLPKIAREYNKMQLEEVSFKEFLKALKNEDGRKIIANYGLDPKLGKYHRTYCEVCDKRIEGIAPVTKCDTCDSKNITMGVFDRIEIIKDKEKTKSPAFRPEYVYQIPLTFIPGLGAKTIDKLLNHFETEMTILHKVSKDDMEAVVGSKISNSIILAREGKMHITEGGRRSLRKSRINENKMNTLEIEIIKQHRRKLRIKTKGKKFMKMRSVFFYYVKNNKTGLIVLVIVFLIGMMAGITFINHMNENQMYEISDYVNSLTDNIKSSAGINKTVILTQSIKQNVLFVSIIWLLGCTLLGSFLIYGAIMYKGFSIGYTAAAIIATLGVRSGTIFVVSSLLLQNLIFLPALLILSDSGIKLYRNLRQNQYMNIKLEFLRHTVIALIIILFAIMASFIEIYISTNFLIFFKEIL